MLRSSFILILGKVLGASFGLITGILLARILGAENLGQYQIFISTQTILVTAVTLGIGNASIYFINTGKVSEKEIVSSFLQIFIFIAIISSLCFFLIVRNNIDYFGWVNTTSLILFLVGTASLVIISILRPILYARHKVRQVTIINLLPSLILVVGIVGLIAINILNVSNVLAIWGLGNFMAMLFLLFYHKNNISFSQNTSKSNVLDVCMYGVKLSASNLLYILISYTSVFFIKKVSLDGFSDLGLYSRALAISSIVYMIPVAVGPLLFSRWSSNLAQDEYKIEIQTTLRIFNTLSFLLFFLCTVFSNLIIDVLYGKEFLSIQYTLIVLLFSLIFQVISEVFNNFLASQGKALITLYALLVYFMLVVAGSLLLIPNYGIVGAAVAVLIGSFTNAMILYILVKKCIRISLLSCLLINNSDFRRIRKNFKI